MYIPSIPSSHCTYLCYVPYASPNPLPAVLVISLICAVAVLIAGKWTFMAVSMTTVISYSNLDVVEEHYT